LNRIDTGRVPLSVIHQCPSNLSRLRVAFDLLKNVQQLGLPPLMVRTSKREHEPSELISMPRRWSSTRPPLGPDPEPPTCQAVRSQAPSFSPVAGPPALL